MMVMARVKGFPIAAVAILTIDGDEVSHRPVQDGLRSVVWGYKRGRYYRLS